jgi:hypothetical protein
MREFAEWLQATPLSVWIQSVEWIIPFLQSIHIVMIGVVVVSSAMISLRVLGKVRVDEPFTAVWRRFAPWMWVGLTVMAATALPLIIAEPVREFSTVSFWVKMTLILLAIACVTVLDRTFKPVAHGPEAMPEFPSGAKIVAVATIVIWIGVVFFGRAIAYDGAVWGLQ